jgi:hypothetical protein
MHYHYSGRPEFTVKRYIMQIDRPLCSGEFCESVDMAKRCWIVWCVAKSAEGLLCVQLTEMDAGRTASNRNQGSECASRDSNRIFPNTCVLPATVEVRPQITQANEWSFSTLWRHMAKVEEVSLLLLTWALDGSEWSAPRFGRITLRRRYLGTHWIGGWKGLRVGLESVEMRRYLASVGNRTMIPRTSSLKPNHCTDWATANPNWRKSTRQTLTQIQNTQ